MLHPIVHVDQVDDFLNDGRMVALYFYMSLPACGESYNCIQDIAINLRPPHVVFLGLDMSNEELEVPAKERFRVTSVPLLLIIGGGGNYREHRAIVTDAEDVRSALAAACGIQFGGQQNAGRR